MFFVSCVLPSRGLRVWLITCPAYFYDDSVSTECDCKSLCGEAMTHNWVEVPKKKKKILSLLRWPVIDIIKPSFIIVIAKLIFTVLIIQSRNKVVTYAHIYCVCVCTVCAHYFNTVFPGP